MRYEILLWVYQLIKYLPGSIGAGVRNLLLPYRHGANVHVMDGVHIDKPSLLVMGDRVSINRGCVINAGGGIRIGSDVLVGPNVVIYSQNHAYEDPGKPIAEQGYVYKSTVIGNNVWLAANCIVLPGVEIGSNVVVAAGAVVTKSVPSGVVIGGNPARVVKVIGVGE